MPPIVCVHGLGGSAHHWEFVGDALAALYRTRVTAVDLPGHGLTRSPNEEATITMHARVVADLLDPRVPAILMGHSTGGAIVARATARHPADVCGLVLVGSALPPYWPFTVPPFAALPLLPALIPWLGTLLLTRRRARTSPERTVEDLVSVLATPERLDPDVRARWVELARERGGFHEAPARYAETVRSLIQHLCSPLGMPADLRAIAVPTLLAHGSTDPLVPVALARATARWRDWPLAVFDDCAHVPQVEVPDQFVATIGARLALGGGPTDLLAERAA